MAKCQSCGKDLALGSKFCEACGTKQDAEVPQRPVVSRPTAVKHRYNALRTIQGMYRVLAWIVLVVGSIAGLVVGGQANLFGGFNTAGAAGGLILGAVVGALGWLVLMSAAEGISVVIDTEENTRRTAEAVLEAVQYLAAPK